MKQPARIVYFSIGVIATLLLTGLFGFFHKSGPDTLDNAHYLKQIGEKYRIFSLPLPSALDFCGEPVPLQDWEVRERLDREILVNTYWQSNMLLNLKRASKWFPVIEPILKSNGIPEDFKYLAVIESGLTNAVSPSGATGFWQFIEPTGKLYGLEINEWVDERYHLEKSTEAACHYLRDAYDQVGSWSMAAAAYNMGTAGLVKQVVRQNNTSYWDLLLNEETGRYLARIVAMKEIMNRPDQYGFVVRPADLYHQLSFEEVPVDSSVADLAEFASRYELTYKTLKLYNPWLRQSSLENKSRKVYKIRVPV